MLLVNDSISQSLDNAESVLPGISEESMLATKQRVEAKVNAMNASEKAAWADGITRRLREASLQALDAYYTFEERKRTMLETVQEAAFGGAWRLCGYSSWEEYWTNELSEVRLFESIAERNDMIAHLKSHGFSQRQIAPVVGLSQVGVQKILKSASKKVDDIVTSQVTELSDNKHDSDSKSTNSGQVITKLSPSHSESSSVPVVQKSGLQGERETVRGINEVEQAASRSVDEMVRDWYWLKGLRFIDGLSARQIADDYSIPRKTVDYTLTNVGAKYTREISVLWLRIHLASRAGKTVALISNELGVAAIGVRFALERMHGAHTTDPSNTGAPWIRYIVDQASFEDWWNNGTNHVGVLKLVTGDPVTTSELAEIVGLSQPRVTQTLTDWAQWCGLPERRKMMLVEQEEGQSNWRVAAGASLDEPDRLVDFTVLQVAAANDITDQFYRKPHKWVEKGKIADSSPSSWFDLVDRHMTLNVQPPEVGPYYNSLLLLITKYYERTVSWINMIVNTPTGVGMDTMIPWADSWINTLRPQANMTRKIMLNRSVTMKQREEALTVVNRLIAEYQQVADQLKDQLAQDARNLPPGHRGL